MYSDLRSKLEMYKTNHQDIKKESPVSCPDITDVAGGILCCNDFGPFFVVEKHFPFSYSHGNYEFGYIFSMDISHVLKVCKESNHPIGISDLLFMDTETTGLSVGAGTVAFLIGVGFFTSSSFVLRQYFMRDYNEELAVLKDLNEILSSYKGLVTFNGKAFDWNLLQSRFIFNRLRPSMKNPAHIDLLYPSRMLWKQKLESCRLSSLEENILGVHRVDDIPGALIPGIYFNYLFDRHTKDIKKVIVHNELDILSMVTLLFKINSILSNPFTVVKDAWELLSVGQIFEKFEDGKNAVSCYEKCTSSVNHIVRELALKKLALFYKGQKEFAKSAMYFEAHLSCSSIPNIPIMIELGKLYEHRIKDIPRAVEIVQSAINACLKISYLRNSYYQELKIRYERLKRKSAYLYQNKQAYG